MQLYLRPYLQTGVRIWDLHATVKFVQVFDGFVLVIGLPSGVTRGASDCHRNSMSIIQACRHARRSGRLANFDRKPGWLRRGALRIETVSMFRDRGIRSIDTDNADTCQCT